jgi:hypothetical protein
MTDTGIPEYIGPRDTWALLPPRIAQVFLGVLYDALDRRPPFEAFELSAFDRAVSKVPPPCGLTSEQFRRAVFEELSSLPWSEGLEPPEGTSWLNSTPIETATDRVFFYRPDPYRFKRKAATRIVAGMRADGLFGPDSTVNPNYDLHMLNARRGDLRVISTLFARYSASPFVHSEMSVCYLHHMPCRVRSNNIFLDPDLFSFNSDEEAERLIRKVWRYADALYRAVIERLDAPNDVRSVN